MVASAQGLDVSNYQGHFDWAATTGLSFGCYRLTQGLGGQGTNSPDPDAGWNHTEIARKGLHRGAYHFLNPDLDGAVQARYFITEHRLLGLTGADMLWCDNETPGPSPAETARCAAAFMAELEKLAPANPKGVYTFIDFAKEGNCDGLAAYPLWLAYPASAAPVPPPPWHNWTFWQWGTRAGTDADAFNGTAAALNAWVADFIVPPPHPTGFELVKGWWRTFDLQKIAASYGISEQLLVELNPELHMWEGTGLPVHYSGRIRVPVAAP